jgi:hypothetical protein
MNPWTYKTKPVEIPPDGAIGFTYLITNELSGKQYIGKKSLISHRTKKVAGRKNRKHTISESDWRSYFGSNEFLIEDRDRDGAENFYREILNWYFSKKALTYAEVEEQFKRNVLSAKLSNGTPAYYNRNILGKFYPDKLDNPTEV